jgi:hypothetical protein
MFAQRVPELVKEKKIHGPNELMYAPNVVHRFLFALESVGETREKVAE